MQGIPENKQRAEDIEKRVIEKQKLRDKILARINAKNESAIAQIQAHNNASALLAARIKARRFPQEPEQETERSSTNRMPVTKDNLHDVISYHAPDAEQISRIGMIREATEELASAILVNCPPCADQQAAIRLAREAMMTANAATRGKGPEYAKDWDGLHASCDRILAFCDRVFATADPRQMELAG